MSEKCAVAQVDSTEQPAESELAETGEQASATITERYERALTALQALFDEYCQAKAKLVPK